VISERNQAALGENIDPGSGPCRLRAAISRANQSLAKRIGPDRGRKRARNQADSTIESEFAKDHVTPQRFGRYGSQGGHEPKGNGKIEMRSFLR